MGNTHNGAFRLITSGIALSLVTSSYLYAGVGKLSVVSGEVLITREQKQIKGTVNSDIEEKDTLNTGPGASTQIIFNDGTVITVGGGSDLKVEEFVSDGAEQKASLSITKGAFKAITGAIGKANPDKFKVSTSTSTIGIRGTRFLGQVAPTGEKIACTKGSIAVAPVGIPGVPPVVVPAGFIVNIAPGAAPEPPRPYEPAELKQMEQSTESNKQEQQAQQQGGGGQGGGGEGGGGAAGGEGGQGGGGAAGGEGGGTQQGGGQPETAQQGEVAGGSPQQTGVEVGAGATVDIDTEAPDVAIEIPTAPTIDIGDIVSALGDLGDVTDTVMDNQNANDSQASLQEQFEDLAPEGMTPPDDITPYPDQGRTPVGYTLTTLDSEEVGRGLLAVSYNRPIGYGSSYGSFANSTYGHDNSRTYYANKNIYTRNFSDGSTETDSWAHWSIMPFSPTSFPEYFSHVFRYYNEDYSSNFWGEYTGYTGIALHNYYGSSAGITQTTSTYYGFENKAYYTPTADHTGFYTLISDTSNGEYEGKSYTTNYRTLMDSMQEVFVSEYTHNWIYGGNKYEDKELMIAGPKTPYSIVGASGLFENKWLLYFDPKALSFPTQSHITSGSLAPADYLNSGDSLFVNTGNKSFMSFGIDRDSSGEPTNFTVVTGAVREETNGDSLIIDDGGGSYISISPYFQNYLINSNGMVGGVYGSKAQAFGAVIPIIDGRDSNDLYSNQIDTAFGFRVPGVGDVAKNDGPGNDEPLSYTGYFSMVYTNSGGFAPTSNVGHVNLDITRIDGDFSGSLQLKTSNFSAAIGSPILIGGSASNGNAAYINDDMFASTSLSGGSIWGGSGYFSASEGKGFFVTLSDGSENDYVSWGYWATELKNGSNTDYITPYSTWVAGEVTTLADNAAAVTAIGNSTATYTGKTIGASVVGSTVHSIKLDANNVTTLNVDFSNGVISGSMNFNDTASNSWRANLVSTTQGSVDLSSSAAYNITDVQNGSGGSITVGSGRIDGKFYGPAAESTGGVFNLNGTSGERATGVFKATR